MIKDNQHGRYGKMCMASAASLQVIDLTHLYQGSDGLCAVAKQLKGSFKDLGFAYIKHHGIAPDLVQQMFQATKDFHALPQATKLAIIQNENYRGFLPSKASQMVSTTQAPSRTPNAVESFITMFDLHHDNPDCMHDSCFPGPNQWPEAMPHLKQVMQTYALAMAHLSFHLMQTYALAMAHLSFHLMQAFAVAFGLEPDALKNLLVNPFCFLRLHRYPSMSPQSDQELFGIAPHTDLGFLTLVAQDSLGGLQVKCPHTGGWIAVPYIPETFVLNAGDMIQRLTNGAYVSSVHRVLNTSGKERYSIPFFFDPNTQQPIEVLDNFRKNKPAQYAPVVYSDYLKGRLTPNYKALQTK